MAIVEKRSFPFETTENKEVNLRGKVALITGSSRDIGAEIAKALAKEGVSIIGIHRDPQKAKREQEITEILSREEIYSEFVIADITKNDDRQRIFKTTKKSFGNKLDFLILNASGPAEDINVIANNFLIDMFLPIIPRGGTIVLMQSVPGHFQPELEITGKMPEFYAPVAKAKYAGEQSLRNRIKEFKEKGVSFVIVCPPEVVDTSNMKIFKRADPQISQKHVEISRKFGLPEKVTKEEVGRKVAKLLKLKDPPMGYTEFFKS